MQYKEQFKELFGQLNKKELIGLKLIDYFDDDDFENELYLFASNEISKFLKTFSCTYPQFIITALSYISLKYYNGNFWDHVTKVFSTAQGSLTDEVFTAKLRNFIKANSDIELFSTRVIDFPLIQSIIPFKFIEKFFDFCFDIYKYNFEFSLKGFSSEDLLDVYNSLKQKINEENDVLEINGLNKSYTLIQATKKIVINMHGINQLVELTEKIIRLIDDFYWDKPEKTYSSYLMIPYNNWKKKITNEEKKQRTTEARKRTEFIKWTPKFVLNNQNVFIETRNDKIPDTFDKYGLKMEILEDDQVIYTKNNLVVSPIIGGYRIRPEVFSINNPLNKIRYRLLCDDFVIYDSEDKLYRDYILFDANGNEFKNHTDHVGEYVALVVPKSESISNYHIFKEKEKYKLYGVWVNENTNYFICDDLVNFIKIAPDGIYGKYDEYASFNNNFDNKVYTSIYSLNFSTKEDIESIYLKINYSNIRLLDMEEMTYENKNGVNYISLDLTDWENDLYKVIIKCTKTDKKISEYNFILDRDFSYKNYKVDSFYVYELKSSILGNKKYKFNLDTKNYIELKYNNEELDCIIKLPFKMPIYCINSSWHTIDECIWKKDFSNTQQIFITGLKIKRLQLADDNGNIKLGNIAFFEDKNVYSFNGAFLSSYLGKRYYLNILDSFNNIQKIEILNEIIYEKLSVDFNDNLLKIKPLYKGKEKLKVSLKHEDNVIVTKSLNNGEELIVENIDSELIYSICVEKFSILSFQYEIIDKKKLLLTNNRLVDKVLKVKTITYSKFFNNQWNEFVKKIKDTYIKVIKEIDNSTYQISLYMEYPLSETIQEYEHLEQTLELTMPITLFGKGCAVIKTEGDLFLYDYTNRKIHDKDDPKAPPIEEIEFEIWR